MYEFIKKSSLVFVLLYIVVKKNKQRFQTERVILQKIVLRIQRMRGIQLTKEVNQLKVLLREV